MSTIAYAAMTTRRDASASGTSTSTSAPGIGTYVDALAALVPAEVLSLHAAVLSFTTETVVDAAGKATVTITEPATLAGVFYALIVFSVLIYVVGRVMDGEWDRWDYARVLIPPLAFVGWTMLQKATAFDAVAKDSISPAARSAIAILGAAVLGAVASVLGGKADRKQPPKKKALRAAVPTAEVKLQLASGDPDWQLRGVVHRLEGDVVVAEDVSVRRTKPATIALRAGAHDYDFEATGGSGEFEIEAVLLPDTSLKKAKFSGADTLDFEVP